MGRRSNTDERRNQIVQAFMEVVARKGFSGASVQEIAAEAGLTPGLIHYHFKSKHEILMTLFARLESEIRERVDSQLQGDGKRDPQRALEAFLDAFLALDGKSDQLLVSCWSMISSEAAIDKGLGAAYRDFLDRQLAEFDALLGAKQRAKAAALLALIQGYFVLSAGAPGIVPRGSAAVAAKKMLRGLLE